MAAITVSGTGWGWGSDVVVGARPASVVVGRWRRGPVYRRRRLVALAVAAAVGVLFVLGALLAGSWALGVLGGGPLTASEAGSSAVVVRLRAEPVSSTTYVVVEGDTLWSIARRFQPTGDVRPLVDALAAARHGRPLQVGEPVAMPHVASR